MKSGNKDKVVNLVDKIPEVDIKNFFNDVKKKNLFMGDAGVLIVPAKFNKYDNMSFERKISANEKLSKKDSMNKKFSEEMSESN